MSGKVKPVIGRIGGKALLAPWIVDFLKQYRWKVLIEPFCGSSAVFFECASQRFPFDFVQSPNKATAVLNDLDERIINLFQVLRSQPDELINEICFTPYSRQEYLRSLIPCDHDSDLERARKYLVSNWQAFGKIPGKGWSFGVNCNSNRNVVFSRLPDRLAAAVALLKHCHIENDDAIAIINRWQSEHACFYLDPPYVDCEDYYNASKGMGEEYHRQLAEHCNSVQCGVIAISYYDHPLLNELYPSDRWDRHYKEVLLGSKKATGQQREKRQEMLLIRKDGNRIETSLKLLFHED